MPGLIVAGTVFAVLAGLVHVFIFALESLIWSRPATWKRFGLRTQAEADPVRPMAFNQGFYNLFLTFGAIVGSILLTASGIRQAGMAITMFSLASMVLAAIVLITSNPKLARSAAIQGVLPLVGLVLLVLGVAL